MVKLKLGKGFGNPKNSGVVTGTSVSKFADWYSQNHYLAIGIGLVGIVALAIVIPVAVYRSIAASNAVSFEAETGTRAGAASIANDTNASGGQYTQFGAGGGGGTAVNGGTDTSCHFYKADVPTHVAFCEGFNQPAAYDARFSRSGDLDGHYWGVSRTNSGSNPSQGIVNGWAPATLIGCGANQKVMAPRDVQICNGRLQEAVFDYGELDSLFGQTTLAMYPKQPFDWAGRTGTVSFDASLDAEDLHAAWPEFWISDQPVPTPHGVYSGQFPAPRNGIGVLFAAECDNKNLTGALKIQIAKNNQFSDVNATIPDGFNCPISKSSASASNPLNHIEIRLNVDSIEVWASNPGSTDMKLLGSANNLGMTMTRGLVWMEDLHYNGCKFNSQCDHTFTWDNLGFDGPALYRDLSFDVPDSLTPLSDNKKNLGYVLPPGGTTTLPIKGVYRLQTPTSALVTFNWKPEQQLVPSFKLNNGPYHDTAWPFDSTIDVWRTIGVVVPVSELNDGDNTITFKANQPYDLSIANINAIFVAGSPVPAALQ